MKLVIVTLSNATIVGASILDYIAQGNTIYMTTKSGKYKLVFGSKEGITPAENESGKADALKAKSDIDSLLVSDTKILRMDNCEIWY